VTYRTPDPAAELAALRAEVAAPIDANDLAALDAATFRGDLGDEGRCEDCGALPGDCGPCCPNNDPWQHAVPG